MYSLGRFYMPSSDVPLSGTGPNTPYEQLKAIATNCGGGYTPTSRNGTTSGSADTYTQVMAANTNRTKWMFQNPPGSGVTMTLAYGAASSEVILAIIAEGGIIEQSRSNGILTSRIAVKTAGTSKAYYAHEA